MLLYLALRYFANASTPDPATSVVEAVSSFPSVVVREGSPLNGLPSPVLLLLALGCLTLAAAVAGLTLGLMSLDSTALEIVEKSNDEKQAEAARLIKPIREQGNLLLVTLLLSNTLAAESLPLILEALVPGGIFSLVASVLSLMLFGEMIPQAVCSRHPLYFGARLIGFVRVLRFIMYPIAAPIAIALDKLLGEELGTMYTRDELKNLIDVHAQSKVLTYDETIILKGTLEFTGKTVETIMTPVDNVFMLDIDAKLDRSTMIEILKHGHSRVPLYDTTKDNIVCLLLVKQLIMVNPDEEEPIQIRRLISNVQTNHKVRVAPKWECSGSTRISDLLNSFQLGRSHLAIVYDDASKHVDERSVIGIVTMEDIIEEILQEEIVDETDLYVDNSNQQLRLVQDSAGRMVFSPLPVPSPASSVVQSSDESNRDLHLQEIDYIALRRPRGVVDHSGMASSPVRIRRRSVGYPRGLPVSNSGGSNVISTHQKEQLQQNNLTSTPSSSTQQFICSPDGDAAISYGDDLDESGSLSEPVLSRKQRRELSRRELPRHDGAERKRRHSKLSVTPAISPDSAEAQESSPAPDQSDCNPEPSSSGTTPEKSQHTGNLHGSDFDTDIEDAARSRDNGSPQIGESDSSDMERAALLQRNSADNVTVDMRSSGLSAINKQAAHASLVRRSSRMGPLLGGISRRSMMSLMDNDNNVLPEDVARAEGKEVYIVCKTPEGELKTQTIMRPVPEYASAARSEIPNRHRRTSNAASTPRRSDGLISVSPSIAMRHPQLFNNYGAVETSAATSQAVVAVPALSLRVKKVESNTKLDSDKCIAVNNTAATGPSSDVHPEDEEV